jgi:hypothetical protein
MSAAFCPDSRGQGLDPTAPSQDLCPYPTLQAQNWPMPAPAAWHRSAPRPSGCRGARSPSAGSTRAEPGQRHENRGDQRAGEADLRAREKQRAQFDIQPLPEADRLRFAGEWRDVQELFVDQPAQAATARSLPRTSGRGCAATARSSSGCSPHSRLSSHPPGWLACRLPGAPGRLGSGRNGGLRKAGALARSSASRGVLAAGVPRGQRGQVPAMRKRRLDRPAPGLHVPVMAAGPPGRPGRPPAIPRQRT